LPESAPSLTILFLSSALIAVAIMADGHLQIRTRLASVRGFATYILKTAGTVPSLCNVMNGRLSGSTSSKNGLITKKSNSITTQTQEVANFAMTYITAKIAHREPNRKTLVTTLAMSA
jgi:hypothetical protein